MSRGVRLVVLVVAIAAMACSGSDTSVSSDGTRPNRAESSETLQVNTEPTATASTTSQPVETSSTTTQPAVPAGPVSITATPARILSGGTLTVTYALAADGRPLGGQWKRQAWASWESCGPTACGQTAWLRIGASPVALPGSPIDRAYLPYDHREEDHPDGPDHFEIPVSEDGEYRVCATLQSTQDGTETVACAPVTVLGVPAAIRPGRHGGWFEIDPANPPTPSSTTLHILAHSLLCERQGAVDTPEVVAGDAEVAIVVSVGPVDCGGRTPSGGPMPVTVRLPSPLGERVVLDGLCLDELAPSSCDESPRGQRWPPL